ncbi:4-hydroxythreonine-4-phosphate dehydrogenase [Clarias magur]|uniref:4-hydroxythreonine-4-phosphate dehydrogenase n=1 Tax=Clarias magur TaxID=1594786 RepID=A0A8J4XFI1_CLAMG|nr:4-hydroxythreonine-4-phosphate dehydrogenase [Clarias magur]
MKIFLLLLLAAAAVIAAPHASEERKLQHVILREIIESVKDMKDQLKAEIFVQNVITTEHCTHKNFCKAGNILSAYKAEDLGLQEKDWLLPRKLVAYTRDINCKDPSSEDRVKLHQLLDNIHQCAQKEFTKP